ncbi:MAG: S8 family serine peptidase [Ahniella sp.]|nr:S8 family serine peptidase [Ahniella sp.]
MKLKPIVGTALLLTSIGSLATFAATSLPSPTGLPTQTESITVANTEADEQGRVAVFVQLAAEPTTLRYAQVLTARGDTPTGRQEAGRAAQQQANFVRAQQSTFAGQLAALNLGHVEIYRIHRAANGLSIRVRPDQLDLVRKLPGVLSVEPVVLHELNHQTSVPFIGAPNTWTNTPALVAGAEGEGVSIGIIDTGVDYQHPNVGGTGVLADYQANDRTVITETGAAAFPTARVVGGFDFAGDLYTGANAPAPDADPMDCQGHGSHVTGSAAGGGVNADGTPFTGPYDNTTNFSALRIGPGVAPRANIYALRVFGCGGSTGLTAQAIDWSTDPNNDDDLSDRLDVINMSLGSNFGSGIDVSTIASDNAAAIGVVVVASAGNAGDTFFISGSPGASQRTIAVASSLDGGFPGAKVQINSPPAIAGTVQAGSNTMTDTNAGTPIPAVSGQTGNVVLMVDAVAPVNDGCTAPTNAAALAGNIAMVDRGVCGFNVKIEFAQNAGAIGVLVADNVSDPLTPAMGGAATIDLTVPAVRISLESGNAIRAELLNGPVNVSMLAANAGDSLSGFSSRGPRGGGLTQILKPDVAAPGQNITSMQTGITCTGTAPSTGCLVANASGFIPAGQTLVISGTSMAAPHVAGTAALMRQQFRTRSVEEIKALVMNGASQKVTTGADQTGATFATSRIGGGRTQVHESSLNTIQAFNDEEPGAVSVSFNVEPTSTNFSASKSVRIVNRGATAMNLGLELLNVSNAPGVDFFLPVNGISVPAAGTATAQVMLSANVTQMDRSRDRATSGTQSAFTGGYLTTYSIRRVII